MITIPQTTSNEIVLTATNGTVLIIQDGIALGLEKSNIKLFVSQLLLLDNESPNNYEKKFDEKFATDLTNLDNLTIKPLD